MPEITVLTNKRDREADLVLVDVPNDREFLDDLHAAVVPAIDGLRTKKPVQDSIVSVRLKDFDGVIARLASHYRDRGYTVTVR